MTPDQLTAFGQIREAVPARVNTPEDGPCLLGRQTSAVDPRPPPICGRATCP